VKKFALIAGLSMAALLLVPLCHAVSPGTNIKVEKDDISISGDKVTERIFFISTIGKYNGTIEIWVPSDHYQVEYGGNELAGVMGGNIFEVNLGEQGIVIPAGGNISLNVSYSIKNKFEDRVIYPTDLMEINVNTAEYPRGNIPVEYKGNNMYTSNLKLLEKDDLIWIEFMKESSAGGMNEISILMGVVAILLAIILIAFAVKGRSREGNLGKESVEALGLRKRLLTDALKTLELEHDKKKIPDTYYRSIKDYFKKEAVRVLRELDRRA